MAAGALSPALDDGVAIKKEIYLSSQCQDERDAAWSIATATCLHCFRCLIFPPLHPSILLQWRYAFIKRKRLKSSLAPKRGVGMPGLIWLNTLVPECAGLLVCMPMLKRSLSCCCSASAFTVGQADVSDDFKVTKVRKPSIYSKIFLIRATWPAKTFLWKADNLFNSSKPWLLAGALAQPKPIHRTTGRKILWEMNNCNFISLFLIMC